MYTGSNKTAIKSQQKLLQSMLLLLDCENYEDITVKNICKNASISKQTFYYLFESKEELVIYYLHSFFTDLEQYINDNKIISLHDLIFTYLSALDNDKYIKKIISITSIMPIFIKVMLKFIDNIHLLKTKRQVNREDYYTHYFLSSGLNNIFLLWLENQKEMPLINLVSLIENILKGNVFE